MRFACWIIKTTNTHSEYVIRITFTRQYWSYERASLHVKRALPAFFLCGEYLAKKLRVVLTLDPVNKGNSVLRNADHVLFKDFNLHQYRCEHLKSRILIIMEKQVLHPVTTKRSWGM